jgi:hypothetical protein
MTPGPSCRTDRQRGQARPAPDARLYRHHRHGRLSTKAVRLILWKRAALAGTGSGKAGAVQPVSLPGCLS